MSKTPSSDRSTSDKKSASASSAQSPSEPLVTAEQFSEASTHTKKRRRKPTTHRLRGSTQAPTPAQQQAEARARSAARRVKVKQTVDQLPRYDIRMAWYKGRWPFIVFLLQFAIVALAVTDGLSVVDLFNTGLNGAIYSLRGRFDSLAIALSALGDYPCMIVICLLITAILFSASRWRSLAFFIVNVLLAVVVIQSLKIVFAIPRPSEGAIVAVPSSYSFPSAHSFMAIIVFGLIGLFLYRMLLRKGVSSDRATIPGIVLITLAILIGISRIYVGVHWPSDVLGGWLLGAAWLSLVAPLFVYEPRS